MYESSVPSSFHIDFKELKMPYQMNIVENQGQQNHAANL